MEEFNFSPTVDVACRCGGKVRIGSSTGSAVPRMDDGAPTPVALHSMPTCKDFDKLDLLSFMRWLRGATDV